MMIEKRNKQLLKRRFLPIFLIFVSFSAQNVLSAYKVPKKGSISVSLGHTQSKPKYTLASSSTNIDSKIPTLSIGGSYKVTKKLSVGGKFFGLLRGAHSENKAARSNSDINGLGMGISASYALSFLNPGAFTYGALGISETRTKQYGPFSQVSFSGSSKSATLGALQVLPLSPKVLSMFRIQTSHTKSNNDPFTFSSAATPPLVIPGVVSTPAIKTYMQNLVVGARLIGNFETIKPYAEWQGSWIINRSRNLKNLNYRMGNALLFGFSRPIRENLSFGVNMDVRKLNTSGTGMGGSVSLSQKF